MKQHGFARDLPWDIVAAGADEARARLSLALSSSPLTRALFPFDFRLVFTYELRDAMLTIDQRILDTGAEGSESMPLHLGFHPYFRVPDSRKSATTITTAATRAFDNVAGVEIPFSGFDLTRRELDLHLVDHGSTGATLRVPGSGSVQISASPEFTHWVVWTQAGRDFVCVEPWSAPGNALNTGKRLLHLAPGEERRLWMKISHTPE
jgi:galactose mutarotase-like enzyme